MQRPRRSFQKSRQARFPALVEDRLRRFDHHLESQRTLFQAQRGLHRFEQVRERGHLLGDHNFGQSDDEVCGKASARGFAQRAHKKIERADAAVAQFRRERLEPDADKRRQRTFAESLGHFLGGKLRVLVLFRIGTISVAVLEINPEILDRLAPQFFQHAAVDRLGHPGGAIFEPQFFRRFGELPLGRGGLLAGFWKRLRPRQSDRARKSERIRREFPERREGHIAQPPGNAGAKQMRAAVHDVNRLAASRFARVAPRERGGRPFQDSQCRLNSRIRQ